MVNFIHKYFYKKYVLLNNKTMGLVHVKKWEKKLEPIFKLKQSGKELAM